MMKNLESRLILRIKGKNDREKPRTAPYSPSIWEKRSQKAQNHALFSY